MTDVSDLPITGPETDPTAPRRSADPLRPPWTLGALAGLVAGAVAVGIGLLAAQLFDTVSPTDAVGSEFIDRVPRWLKELAVNWFGTNDKRALRFGMFAVMAIIAALFGVKSRKDPWVGVMGFALFGLVGALAAMHRPAVPNRAAFAPVIGSLVGALAIAWLVDALTGWWREARTPHRSRAPLGLDRRRFLVSTGAVAAVAVTTSGAAAALEGRRVRRIENSAPRTLPVPVQPVPTTAAPSPGSEIEAVTPYITPNGDFYRIDTALSFPRIDVNSWKMRITGMIDHEIELSYADLLARPQVERTVTLCCVSNEVGGDLIGNAVWQGVLLADLLKEAGVQPGAEQVFSTSVDGWTSGFPVSLAMDGRDALVAIGMNGHPLPLEHGFPVRLVVPGLYGYVSATKWLSEIQLTTWDAHEGYWVPRGWSREGPVKTESRIDVPRRRDTVLPGPTVIAGVAWAQHRGISKVEVQVDDGPWAAADMGTEDTDDAWRQWVLKWDATAGTHTIKVRATDKTGATQTEEVAAVAPDGATGYHTRRIRVSG